MKTRVLSGLIMAPLLLFVLFGGYILYAGCLAIAIMGLNEFYRGFKPMGYKASLGIGVVSVVVLYAIAAFITKINMEILPYAVLFWIFLSVLACLLYLFKINERKVEDALVTLCGIFYVGFFSVHIVLTDVMFTEPSMKLGSLSMSGFLGNPVWLIFITAFCSDIFAYFTGYLFGKHKLCPVISPKKTIEGAVGGVVGTIICTWLFGYFCLSKDMSLVWIIIGLAGSVLSMYGDLTASIFKRKMGIKDYGNLIPGHGGIMDRVDSVMFTAPVIFYVMAICSYVTGGWL